MFDVNTFETLLIPQIACGDDYLRSILTEKFNFLYLKNKSIICDDRWVYVKMQIDLIELARMTARKKVDFLKRIEDSKSNRFYNAGGFIDATSSRKAEGFASAFSRARSNQDFYRFSESHDKARSDTKAEHHGLTESKAFDTSRSENKAETRSTFQSNAQSAGVGRGSSCSASKSESSSVTTTGSMQPFEVTPNSAPKVTCELVDELSNCFGLNSQTYEKVFDCFPNSIQDGISNVGEVFTCLAGVLTNTTCDTGFKCVQESMNSTFQISHPERATTFLKSLSGVNMHLLPHHTGFRTSWSPVSFPEIYTTSPFDAIAGYSALAMTRDVKSESCDRAYITPSSGRSWQLSYRFGVSFGFGGTLSLVGGFQMSFNLRTQISLGNSYKESEVCTTGNSQRLSDSKTNSFYRETSTQASQGHSNTTDRSSTKHNAERRGMSKRDAYSKHSSCSFSTMDSTGRSHTDSERKAHSESTSFGSGESRKEGHSHGEGKSINRTQAILESRMYSQIFKNLTEMLKRVQKEFDDVIERQTASLGYSTSHRDDFEWCDTACNNYLTI